LAHWTLSTLNPIPRLGWNSTFSPVMSLDGLARELKLAQLSVKRDDLCGGLHGSTKARKLDYLLAIEPFASASSWASIGAIGSGHLVALTCAAEQLERRLEATMFWEPISAGVLDNLAYTATGPTRIHYVPTRLQLALRNPRLFLSRQVHGSAVIPPGATCAPAMVGTLRAGLELAEQIRRGEVLTPERIYVALGSGGTVVGLALGLALGEVRTTLHAVATVERVFATRFYLTQLHRKLVAWLKHFGLGAAGAVSPVPITIDHSQVGAGYGITTDASVAACARLVDEGLQLEPIYTGKTMAALMADARQATSATHVMYWHTARRDPLPLRSGWRDRLPAALIERLEIIDEKQALPTRRWVLATGIAATAAVVVASQLRTSEPPPPWRGSELRPWEAEVLTAATEALLHPGAAREAVQRIPRNIERYIQYLPPSMIRDVHLMLTAIQYGAPMTLRWTAFTRMAPLEREAYLVKLAALSDLSQQLYRAIRDLIYLGYYQEESSWQAIGYGGPWITSPASPEQAGFVGQAHYEALRARPGHLPKGVIR